jgi:hypothetical protein
MAYLSNTQQQLAPTVGPKVPGAWIRAGFSFAGISDTVIVGRILYAGNLPIVLDDELWIPARLRPNHCTIFLISGIHIFIGKLDTLMEDRSGQESSQEFSALDLKKSRPTQIALEEELVVEDRCRSALVNHAFETQRYHFVGHIGYSSAFGSSEAGGNNESILEALDQVSGGSDDQGRICCCNKRI